MQQALDALTTHPTMQSASASPAPGVASAAMAPLRPPRRSWMSRLPLALVVALTVIVALGWTAVRLADPRAGPGPHSLLQHHSDRHGTEYAASAALGRPILCAVWLCVSLLLWSLAQTYRTQGRNCVEREDQYIRDVRFEKLWGAAEAEAADSAAESSASLWPDLSEYVPGFVLEWTDVCGATGVVDQTPSPLQMRLENSNGAASVAPAASPSTTRLMLSKRVPFGSDSVLGPSLIGIASAAASTSTSQSTPHILLPTLTSKINGCRRWCGHCSLHKPDRAHHCFRCGRCIKKMDHCCSLISCCIGFSNYKFFLLFLGYAWAAAALIVWDLFRSDALALLASSSSAALGSGVSGGGGGFGGESGPGFILAVILMLCGSLVLVLPIFLLFHARLLLLEGSTTLEWNEVRPKRAHFLGTAHPSELGHSGHPYKLPPFQAWCGVFGTSAWGWFLPVGPAFPRGRKAAATASAAGAGTKGSGARKGSVSGGATILRTAGRGSPRLIASGSPSTGTDLELDELSAVPLLSSLTAGGSPIAGPAPLSKSVLATFELAAWESRHPVPRAQSVLERMHLHQHPLYDQTAVEAVAAAQGHGSAWASKGARLRAAAQGLLGQEESQLIAEWQARGLLFPTHPSVVNPQMALWREGKLFKQA